MDTTKYDILLKRIEYQLTYGSYNWEVVDDMLKKSSKSIKKLIKELKKQSKRNTDAPL